MTPNELPDSRKRTSPGKVTETLRVKNWVTGVTTQQQVKVINFLLWAYGGLLTATMLIFFLQGFRIWGFSLDVGLLRWLGGATVGAMAGLLALTLRAVFRSR
jgi:hypothetical protein